MPVLTGWIGHTVDVAIVGAGAAGLAAARHLGHERPDLKVLALEAADRIGGRACTQPGELAVDLGCGWLHGAQDNAWTGLAPDLGFTVDRTPAPWNDRRRDTGLSHLDDVAADAALQQFFERVDGRDTAAGDPPLSDFLEPGGRWNGLVGAVGTYINGAELDQASTLDYDRYEPGPPPDWRVREGYGRLVSAYGAAMPVVLDTPVGCIAHGDSGPIAIETSRGVLRSRAVILTISTTCLAEGAIRFDPPLPDKMTAAAGLPLGLANKLFLAVADPDDLPVDGNLLGSPFRVGTGAYQMRPFGRPVIEAYFGGSFARDLEAQGPDAAFSFAADELAGHFGNAFRSRLTLHAASAWAGAPWIKGSYSYAKPGEAEARSALAAPVDGRLFFAGEACSPHRFSTAHGAYETGVAAAEAVAAVLRV